MWIYYVGTFAVVIIWCAFLTWQAERAWEKKQKRKEQRLMLRKAKRDNRAIGEVGRIAIDKTNPAHIKAHAALVETVRLQSVPGADYVMAQVRAWELMHKEFPATLLGGHSYDPETKEIVLF